MTNATVEELETALEAELANIQAKTTHIEACDHPKCVSHRELGGRRMDMSFDALRLAAAGQLPPDECEGYWELGREHGRLEGVIRPWRSRSTDDYDHEEHLGRLEVAGLPYPYSRGLQARG